MEKEEKFMSTTSKNKSFHHMERNPLKEKIDCRSMLNKKGTLREKILRVEIGVRSRTGPPIVLTSPTEGEEPGGKGS